MSGSLTPEQVLRVAVAHLQNGIDQHHLAQLMGVNQGRINEAVKALDWAIHNHRQAYALARGWAHVVEVAKDDPKHPDNRGFDGPTGAE
jgi:predicted transcriptional regulator